MVESFENQDNILRDWARQGKKKKRRGIEQEREAGKWEKVVSL